MSDNENPKAGNGSGTFSDDFKARLDRIESDAKKAGVSMNELCKAAGVSRATPQRWRKKPPVTVKAVDRLEDGLRAALAKKTA